MRVPDSFSEFQSKEERAEEAERRYYKKLDKLLDLVQSRIDNEEKEGNLKAIIRLHPDKLITKHIIYLMEEKGYTVEKRSISFTLHWGDEDWWKAQVSK